MFELSTFAALFLLCSVAGGVGYLAATVAIWSLKRVHYRLECDITDLQNSLLVEIKKRAGAESAKSRKQDAELLAQLQNGTQATKSSKPWWMEHVHPDLRTS